MTTLISFYRAIEEMRKLDPELPLQTVAVFVAVALKPGITMKDLGPLVGLSQASISRNVAALAKTHRLDKPGLDLLIAREDPVERRRKIVELTPKGRGVLSALLAALEER